jgi:hypothetical protein
MFFFSVLPFKLVLLFSRLFRLVHYTMDHAQGREHHHLARAIMHLNYIAGMLPFFEPAIEWDDPMGDPYSRYGRSNQSPRHLHTFVPLPSSSSVPTMASHGGIPTHMAANPEPHLRPLSIVRRPRDEGDLPPTTTPTLHNSASDTAGPPLPNPDTSHVSTRTTTPVPVRSKQRSAHLDDSQPKKKPRSGGVMLHSSTSRPVSLPVITDVPHDGFNSDDSDEEVTSGVNPVHTPAVSDVPPTTVPSVPSADRPNSPPPEIPASTSVPKAPPSNPTIRIPPPAESDRGTVHSSIRPWSGAEDHELINLRNDSKSRPSWKSIGARLRRDPQICKIRWNILKQMTDQPNLDVPRHEPEAED